MTELQIKRSLLKEVKEICEACGLPPIPVIFSNKLKKSNGLFSYRYSRWELRRANTTKEILNACSELKITISNHIFKFFGENELRGTLMHEVAHYIDFARRGINRNDPHDRTFKQICVKLGGTMNEKLAGTEFSEAATGEFVSRRIGFRYECKCGHGNTTLTRRMSAKSLLKYHCPKCKAKCIEWNVTPLV